MSARRRARVRKGQLSVALQRDEFAHRFRAAWFDPRFSGSMEAIDALGELAWHAHQEGRKAPRDRGGGARVCRPALRAFHRMAGNARARTGSATPACETHWSRTRAHRQCVAAQRSELPRRNVEDAPARNARPGGARWDARNRNGAARSQSLDRAIRASDLSVQGLRLDGDAALSLAVLVL